VIDGNYTLATPEMISNKKVEKIQVGAEFAFSFSTHEYGKLGQENPQLRKIVEKIRTDAQDYCSNRLGDLKRAARKILSKQNGGIARETKSFEESAKKIFSDWEKSVKTKASRGDPSAKPEKYKAAVAAFWKVYNT
jgi:TRAP-type C4-dicarboxylate transport system substrate-binding protein